MTMARRRAMTASRRPATTASRRNAMTMPRCRGMTLAELLVVMAIGAVMISLTVASFAAAGRRESREGAAETVMGLLRQAKISAVDGGRGAVVRLNPNDRSLFGIATAVLGAWHFEQVSTTDVTPGAKRNDGTLSNSLTPVPGKIGLCLDFDGIGDDVDCGQLPVWDQNEGIRLEAWVNPNGALASSGTVLYGVMGKSDATDGYMLGVAHHNAEPDETYHVHGGCYTDQAVVHVQSETTIPGNMWSHLAFEFDGYEARIFINGILADLDSYRQPEDAPTSPVGALPNPVPDPNPNPVMDETWAPPALIQLARGNSLLVGAVNYAFMGPLDMHYFQGMIDEPQILSIAGGQRTYLPERVRLVTAEPVVHFDGQGYLDIAYHSGPVYVAVGDPYQASTLDVALPAAATASFTLRNSNPFPPGGGLVIIGDEIIEYDDTNLLQCNTLQRGRGNTADADHAAGDPVLFARVMRVTATGVVERVKQ
jgi:prepilin-type N-terminal cleavage/methylation domain-containing protein